MRYRNGYKPRYRKKYSSANSILTDTLHIANRTSWWGAVILGSVLFTLFFWGLPAWINHTAGTIQEGFAKQIVVEFLARRIHWSQWFGISLGLICIFFAIRNYFSSVPYGYKGQQTIGFLGKLLGRWVD